ncbi:uncharacterized protein [Dendrobates tinctorius]|uniref:uncharacterized protein n=1 Tax=Dendrobates tinctorius TaxID=92724 RepID=UPI003CC98994
MNNAAWAVCVISALISTASCLQCTTCSWILQKANDEIYASEYGNKVHYQDIVDGQPICLGFNYTCTSPEEVCGSIYVKTTKYDQSQEIFIKRDCIKAKECNVSESFTTPVLKTLYAVTCCNTDNCTPAPQILPPENNTENGVQCQSCFLSSTMENCEAKYSVTCTGKEKYCIAYERRAPFETNYVYAMGCASKNVCTENGALHNLGKPGLLEEVKCHIVTHNEQLQTGHFIWCFFCHDYNVNNCSDKAYLCKPEEDVCVFERVRSIYDGREEVTITKRCGKSNECSRSGTIRSSTKTIFMNTTCCDYNVCQAPLPTLPQANDDENGLTCPACFVPNSDRCLGRSNLKCTGNEQRCIHYMRTEVRESATTTESLHGCTTDEICEAGSAITYTKGQYHRNIKTSVMCSSAVGWRAPLCTILCSMALTFIILTHIASS